VKKTAWLARLLALSLSLSPLYAQQGSAPQTSPASSTTEDEVVRITTNLVQLDVVVTDKDGRQVTNLSAEDFEIREDGRTQAITNFSYISTVGTPPAPANTAAVAAAAVAPPTGRAPVVRPARLNPRDVRRTIVLLVDDLGLSFESVARLKPTLHKFVDTQLQPGDLVAIIRTGGNVGALQQFTTDRRQLHRSVDSMRWNSCSRQGLHAFSPSSLDLFATPPRSGAFGIPPRPIPGEGGASACSAGALLSSMNAIRFVLQGMRELPGRKSMIIISDNLPVEDRRSQSSMVTGSPQGGGGAAAMSVEPASGNLSVAAPLRRISELAIRASVVIYGIDVRGLPDVSTISPPDISPPNASGMTPSQRSARFNLPGNEVDSGREVGASLARQTGGRLIYNTNDIGGSLRRVMEDQKGYYLIGYRPGGETFNRRFHKISVRVKRPGLTARTRTGFYGVTDEDARPAPPSARDQTLTALMSPFGAGEINVRVTPLFADSPETGSILRSLLHVNARDLAFTNEPDGAHKATIQVTGVIFNDNGGVAGEHRRTHTLTLRGRTYERVLAEGFSLVFNMPVKKAGAYQFRIAVRDEASARLGAAGQFVEVPDLRNGRLALSGIALTGAPAARGEQNATAALRSASGSPAPSGGVAPEAACEACADDAGASPAVRRFHPDMSLEYEFFIYNAQPDKATNRPRLTMQAQLFRDGQQVYAGDAAPLDLGELANSKLALARGQLALGGKFSPGEYTLQLVLTDELAKEKQRTATQWIDFEIVQ
jgi:VWFA-related protein